MNDLPDLPFEKVLSYLGLEDRLRLRAVSRSCHEKIANSRVKTLCFSQSSIGRICEKNRWVSGAFAANFISSTRFATFFDTFGQTILSSLKHLRLCDLKKEDRAAFARTLNSFSQLEKLAIIRARFAKGDQLREFNLNLPMLTRLQLEDVEIDKLTLEAPRLREFTILNCSGLRLEIVHGELVERLLIDRFGYTEVKNLKNLLYLYVDYLPWADPTPLFSLQKLKEIHTYDPEKVSELFEQKQRSGRTDLKIYLCGLLLNGPGDPALNALQNSAPYYLSGETLVCLAENPSRRADMIPFYRKLPYSNIERVSPGLEIGLLKLFTDLNEFIVYSRVQDIQRFLDLLKNFKNIMEIMVFNGYGNDQPQDLFDRLPEHCAVQKLFIERQPSDLAFLFRLKHLIKLVVNWSSIDTETVRKVFEELPVLSLFRFVYGQKMASIQIDHPKKFQVSVDDKETFSDLNAAIEFIFGKKKPSKQKKRKPIP